MQQPQFNNISDINFLALTSLINGGVISRIDTGKYEDWTNAGWNIHFEVNKTLVLGKWHVYVYAVMEADFPHGKERKSVLVPHETVVALNVLLTNKIL